MHAEITWDGQDSLYVSVRDLSLNGTSVRIVNKKFFHVSHFIQINGLSIGKGNTALMKSGDIIQFASSTSGESKYSESYSVVKFVPPRNRMTQNISHAE